MLLKFLVHCLVHVLVRAYMLQKTVHTLQVRTHKQALYALLMRVLNFTSKCSLIYTAIEI